MMHEKLHLRVNGKKTEAGSVFGRKFLGYCLQRSSWNTVKVVLNPKALDTFKQRNRVITRRVARTWPRYAEQMRAYIPR